MEGADQRVNTQCISVHSPPPMPLKFSVRYGWQMAGKMESPAPATLTHREDAAPAPATLTRGHIVTHREDGIPAPATLTHGHIVIRGIREAQQQLWPLAAQLVGLVLGFQLYFCKARKETAMKLQTRPMVPIHPLYCPPTMRTVTSNNN